MIIDPIPDPRDSHPVSKVADLCPVHRGIWLKWRSHAYNRSHPKDWPGQPLMDSRTSHAVREQTWRRRDVEQMDLTAELCRSGRSPQCDHRPPQTRQADTA